MGERVGHLEVIAGPMFSGKTEELIRLIKRAVIGKKEVQIFKHGLDNRYGKDEKIYTHDGISFNAEIVSKASDIFERLKDSTEIVAIDESQWFGNDLIPVVEKLLDLGKKVIISGLALTFDRQPFEPIPALMAMADKVVKLSAICSICGEEAVFHKRLANNKNFDAKVIDPKFVGKSDIYQARCRRCFNKK